MRKILLILILAIAVGVIAGCGEMTYEERMAWSQAFQNMSQQQQAYQEQKLRDAQYDYYKRPYKVGGTGPTIYP